MSMRRLLSRNLDTPEKCRARCSCGISKRYLVEKPPPPFWTLPLRAFSTFLFTHRFCNEPALYGDHTAGNISPPWLCMPARSKRSIIRCRQRRRASCRLPSGWEPKTSSTRSIWCGAREELNKCGFDARVIEMKGHDHDYYAVAAELNPKMWEFLAGSK